ncbi:MAG: biotin--[acetyl-CoA-carboxylase] ligase [Candidatus Heimdallarchaeota archaeon]
MLFKEEIHYEVESTQKLAVKIAKSQHNAHGTVIIAEKQTKGLGRTGRRWESPVGGLYLSVIIQKPLPIKLFHGFSVRLGLEMAKLLEEKFSLPFKVKWPNDIMLNGKKIGGILIDMNAQNEEINYLVVGIGFNVNIRVQTLSDETRNIATSLLEAKGERVSIKLVKDLILRAVANVMEELETNNLRDLKQEWKERSLTFGQKIFTELFGEGAECIEKGITDSGDLIIELDGKEEIISNGDITLIR